MTPAVVSVWCVPLLCPASAEQRMLELLDPAETARATRFATTSLRSRYVVSRGALRLILSRVTGRHAGAIRFSADTRGKSSIAGGPHFSLSRSADVALVAVSAGAPIGVDVEHIRAELPVGAFARHLIAAPDIARIEALPAAHQLRAWYRAWTRLEAVAKACGTGLREDRTSLDRRASPFTMSNLEIDDAYVGAVAVDAPAAHVVYEALSEAPLP